MQNKKAIKRVLMGAASAIIWLGVWTALYFAVNRDVLIASPLKVLLRLLEMLGEKQLYIKAANSLWAILKGYLSALLAGTALAVLTSKSEFLRAVFKPFMNVVRSTPVASFIILALVWMTKKNVPVFTSFLMVMPIVWSNISTGINSTDGSLLEMARAYMVPKRKIISKIYLPSVMPEIYNSVTTGLGFAWKSGVAAEVLSTPVNTIGSELYNSKVYLETTDLFAWTAVIIIMSMLLEKAAVYLLRRLFNKFSGGEIK